MVIGTLDNIIDDIILTARNSNVSRSENLSKRQVEFWIRNYRVLLLKQDADKGRPLNPDYLQTIPNIELEVVDRADENNNPMESGYYRLKSIRKLPVPIDLTFGSTLVITDMLGAEIQVIPKSRMWTVKNKRWTGKELYAYIEGGYIYIESPDMLEYISATGLFENPDEVTDFFGPVCYDRANTRFPIPSHLIPTIKQMIFSNDLKIQLAMPTDLTNDSQPIAPNSKDMRQ